MSNSITTVLYDTGYIDDIEKYCSERSSTRKGHILRTMHFLFEKDDSVSYKRTTSYTGINKHSGKRWFRVETDSHYTFKVRQLKNGRKYLYIWDIPTNRKKRNHPVDIESTWLPHYIPATALNKVIEFCEKEIGPVPGYISTDSTTILNFYSRPNSLLLTDLGSGGLKNKKLSLRTSDPADIMKHFMGSKYSSKLSGLLRNKTSVASLRAMSLYPEEFKTDWIIEDIRNKIASVHTFRVMTYQDYVVDVLPESMRRKFFLDFLKYPSLVNDIIRYLVVLDITREEFVKFKQYFGKGYEYLHTLHETLYDLEVQKRDVEYSQPFELDPLPKDLCEEGFRLPENKKDLQHWSNHFSNCVSTYASEVSRKETVVLNRNDEVCLEIRDKKLVQYLGKYNRNVTPEMFWDGVDILLKYDMIDEQPNESCWGYQPVLEKV